MKIEVQELAVARGGVPVLQDVGFVVSAGQAMVLRGPNGIGKTSLLRVLAGLQPVVSGTLGFDLDEVAYAGHADGIKAQLSVSENLAFWAAVFGTQGIEPALEQFDLLALRDRPAGALSAGQKRRLGLARLCVTGRKIWILDEPTVSLDVGSVALFAQAIRRHLDAGGIAIMATHIDLGLAEAQVLDLTPFKAELPAMDDFDGAFL